MDDQWSRRIADRLRWDQLVVQPGRGGGQPPPPNTAVTTTLNRLLGSLPPDNSAAIIGLVHVTDPFEFVRRAYRLVLGREASDDEIRRRGRLLKYVPFYTRLRMIERLLASLEGRLYRLAEQSRAETAACRAAAYLQALAPQLTDALTTLGQVADRLTALEETR